MENQGDYKMIDLMKYANAYNLGWRLSRYEKNDRMNQVILNLKKFNKEDSFCDGLLSGFEAGRSKSHGKQKRMNELDVVLSGKKNEKQKGLER